MLDIGILAWIKLRENKSVTLILLLIIMMVVIIIFEHLLYAGLSAAIQLS